MNQDKLKNILEAVLMVSDKPRNMNYLLTLFEKDADLPEKSDIRAALTQLQMDYTERGTELKEVASGFRFQVRPEYSQWVNRIYEDRPQRYSRALLETLAIIAYRQPITRGEIENIRGVSVSSNIVRTLQEREWVKVVGHRDVPGKPELLATTRQFLDYFNLKKLSELPSLEEIKDFDQINPDLFDSIEAEQGEADPDPATEVTEQTAGEEIPAAETPAAVTTDAEISEEESPEIDLTVPEMEEETTQVDTTGAELETTPEAQDGQADAEQSDPDEPESDDNVVPFTG